MHLWYGGHSTSINICRVWGIKSEIQVSRKKFHTHIHLRLDVASFLYKKFGYFQFKWYLFIEHINAWSV